MTPIEVITFLRRYNEWRRTDDRYGLPYPDPREIGEAIDAAVEMIERLEAAEKERDAAELMSLALRAKIEQMEKQEPVGYMPLATKAALEAGGSGVVWNCRDRGVADEPLYALPGAQAQPAQSIPSEEAAAEMGANGGHVVEAERLAFEAWMRGHCWKLGAKWTGTEYRSAFEKGGMVDMHAMRTRELWAAWRDRAALAAAPEAKP